MHDEEGAPLRVNRMRFGEGAPNANEKLVHIDLPKGAKDVPVGKPLAVGQRGAVLSYSPDYLGDPPVSGDPSQFNVFAPMFHGLPRFETHDFYPPLLLFDRVEFSQSEGVERRDPGIAVLVEQGLLTPVGVTGKDFWSNSTIRRDGFDIWQARNSLEPGLWSIWYTGLMDPIPPEESVPDLAFKLQLQDSLILPDPAVPLEDILAFRDRRRSELMALRHHMDELAIRASKEGHELLSDVVSIEKFRGALQDYVRTATEPNWKKFVASLDVEINWSQGLVAGAAGAVAAGSSGLSVAVAAGAGVLASLGIKSVRGVKSVKVESPFAYLVHSVKEFPAQKMK